MIRMRKIHDTKSPGKLKISNQLARSVNAVIDFGHFISISCLSRWLASQYVLSLEIDIAKDSVSSIRMKAAEAYSLSIVYMGVGRAAIWTAHTQECEIFAAII